MGSFIQFVGNKVSDDQFNTRVKVAEPGNTWEALYSAMPWMDTEQGRARRQALDKNH